MIIGRFYEMMEGKMMGRKMFTNRNESPAYISIYRGAVTCHGRVRRNDVRGSKALRDKKTKGPVSED
jgi:hypothetical protein